MFKKILVANRGEIARRIFLACRELGVRSVAVYSDADRNSHWTRLADESYRLPGATAGETYLNQDALFEVAQRSGVDAIHPGYGFLSENAGFAAACADHGIVFIGPDAETMRIMGSKSSARLMAKKAGAPIVPGVDGDGKTDVELLTTAASIGYPVLIKASAGGGGKGMRVVWTEAEFPDSLRAARREARSAFGNDQVLVEKYFTQVHHVEFQVLGDSHGNLLHLFERECSVQRRHQKIIEESPAPILPILDPTGALCEKMAAAAVALARTVNYVNAGTIEFVVDASEAGKDCFYFLEMNTRLQVEHPVTEQVTGLDLVAWQIRIAAGEELPLTQEDLTQKGHAIECRVYAEDPANQFLPSTGLVTTYRPPSGPGVRVEDGIETGAVISAHYDPMIAKIIAWGHDRPSAIRKLVRALRDTVVMGVTTNIPYLLDILHSPEFIEGRTSTNYLQQYMASWRPGREASESDLLAIAAFELLHGTPILGGKASDLPVDPQSESDPWQAQSSWRNVN